MKCNVQNGHGTAGHNNRTDYSSITAEHIDAERTKYNVTFVDKDERAEFVACFDASCKEYEKYCRKKGYKDRAKTAEEMYEEKVTKHHKKDGSEYLVDRYMHESIFQFGNAADLPAEYLSEEQREKITKVYEAALEEFQKRNPLVRVTQAVIHFDEATPHMHVRWFTVVEKTRGMKLTPDLSPAMRAMGYTVEKESRWENPIEQFSTANREHFREWLLKCKLPIEEFERVVRDENGKQIGGKKYTETIQDYKIKKKAESEAEKMLLDARYTAQGIVSDAKAQIQQKTQEAEIIRTEAQKARNEAFTLLKEVKRSIPPLVTFCNGIKAKIEHLHKTISEMFDISMTQEGQIRKELRQLYGERNEAYESIQKNTELVREVEPEYEPRGMHGEALEELEEDELELW